VIEIGQNVGLGSLHADVPELRGPVAGCPELHDDDGRGLLHPGHVPG